MNKTAIKNFAIKARLQLMEAVRQKAYEYDIKADVEPDPMQKFIGDRMLDDTEFEQRQELCRQIHIKGYKQVVEETAYTWFNRFIALRFMEVNGYIPSRIRIFTDENGEFKPEILKEAVNVELEGVDKEKVIDLIESQSNEELYKYLIIAQCNELNAGLPYMFEKISNWTELLFPSKLLRQDSVIACMVKEIPESDWTEQVQIIGWLYQFYISEKHEEIVDVFKGSAVKKEDVPAATQLFTTDWVVRYILDNSLGRYWLERHPKSRLAEKLHFLALPKIGQFEYVNEDIMPEEIKVFDPCVGSGHFLVYAFDIMMEIYREYGYTDRDAAKSIVENNLYGLDIDDRASQLAYFAVMMKARSFNRKILNGQTVANIASIQESNGFNTDYLSLFDELEDMATRLVDIFKDAKEYGTVLDVSLSMQELIKLQAKCFKIRITEYDNFFDTIRKAGVITEFLPLINQAIIMAQKYDIVATNPPYLNKFSPKLKAYITKNFADYKGDLFSVFMFRNFGFCKPNGYSGFMTPNVWMFIKSYELLRNYIIANKNISTLVQMAKGAFFKEATVDICAFVLCNNYSDNNGLYFRLEDFKGDMEVQKQKVLEALKDKENCKYYFESTASNFSKIPGSPVAYWVSEAFIKAFESKTIGEYGEVITGMTIGDNNKYLRLWFEIIAEKINFNKFKMSEINIHYCKWIPYSKGGARRNWYGNYDYVVNWSEKDNFNRSKTTLQHLYLKEAITWPFITSGDFSARLLPAGSLWDVAGSPCFFNSKEMEYYILGFMASKVCNLMLKITNPTINVQAVDVARLPIIIGREIDVGKIANDNITVSKSDWDSFETSWDFKRNPLL